MQLLNCIHTHMNAHTHKHTYIHAYAHTHTCKCRNTHMHTHIHAELSLYILPRAKTELMPMSKGDRKKLEQTISWARFMEQATDSFVPCFAEYKSFATF